MGKIYLFTMLCLCMGCKPQKSILYEAEPSEQQQPGGCYYSYITEVDQQADQPFVLEIVPPKFEEIETKINPDELEKYEVESGKYQFYTSRQHFKYTFRDEDLKNFVRKDNAFGYMFCFIEVPASSMIISKSDLTEKDYIIKQMQISEKAKITKKYIKAKPDQLKGNERFFPSGNWSELKPANYPSH